MAQAEHGSLRVTTTQLSTKQASEKGMRLGYITLDGDKKGKYLIHVHVSDRMACDGICCWRVDKHSHRACPMRVAAGHYPG